MAYSDNSIHTDDNHLRYCRLQAEAYIYNFLDPVTQNISISWRNSQAGSPSILAALPGDLLLCRNGSYPTTLRDRPATLHRTTLQ